MRRGRLVLPLAVMAALVLAAPAGAQVPPNDLHFGSLTALPGSPATGGSRQGGEPSLTFDPRDASSLYAAAPGAPDHGGNFWRSTDGGATFLPGQSVGSSIGGGDEDVAVGYDQAHTVFYADLETLIATDLCRSTDHGATFAQDNCSTDMPTNQESTEPAVDRPWIATDPTGPQRVYSTYDGLLNGGGAPEVAVSTDGGSTFLPCGQVLQPGSDAFAHFSPTGALENSEVIGPPAVGPDGSIYVPFTEPHTAGQLALEPNDPTPSNLYLGIAKGGCSPASPVTFTDIPVFQNDQGPGTGSDFVSIFPYVAVDPAGNVFVLGDGKLNSTQKGDGVYLFVLRHGASRFSKPILVNTNGGAPQAAQLATLAAGNGPGEVVVGWYGTSNGVADHNDPAGEWKYYAAETFDFGRTFTQTTVTPQPLHHGAICNLGVLCTGGRNLLDFTSVAVNPDTGCAALAIPGDPYDPAGSSSTPATAYVTLQTGGPCLTPEHSGLHAGTATTARAATRLQRGLR